MGTAGKVIVPADFWGRPEVSDALAQRDIGALLSMVLAASGLSQHAFAARTGVTQTQVSQYVNGQRKPTLDLIARLADGLAMPPDARSHLRLSVPGGSAHDTGLPPVKLHRVLALAEHIGRTGDAGSIEGWREATRPRSSTEPWEQLARVIGKHSPPEEPPATTMAIRTSGFYLVAAKLPAQHVIRALTAHVRDIIMLLDAVGDEQQRRELTITGGESSYLAACCDVDLGNLAGALDLLDTVAAAARKAADLVLAAMAADGQSHYQAFQGHHHRALELIEQARASCPPNDSPGTIAYLWLRTAEEQACLGHLSKAARAWEESEEHYERTDLDSDRNWVRLWLSRDCFESVRAVICSATGQQKKAAENAERVATRLARRDGKTDAIALINAALAQARIGLFNAAAATGLCALRATRAAEASGCLPRAQEVAALLASQAGRGAKVTVFLRDLDRTKKQLGMPF